MFLPIYFVLLLIISIPSIVLFHSIETVPIGLNKGVGLLRPRKNIVFYPEFFLLLNKVYSGSVEIFATVENSR